MLHWFVINWHSLTFRVQAEDRQQAEAMFATWIERPVEVDWIRAGAAEVPAVPS